MIIDKEDKRKIKLICEIFNAQSIFIDGVRCELPKRNRPLTEGEGEINGKSN